MVKYHCEICRREFSTASRLTQYINTKHIGRTLLSQSYNIQLQRPEQIPILKCIPKSEHNEKLWSIAIVMLQPQSQLQSQSQSQLFTILSTSFILEETSIISQIIDNNYD